MPLRVYITPVIGSGTNSDPYASKARSFGYAYTSFFPSNADGSPASSWVVAFIRSSDFSAIAADTTCDDLFAGDLPASIVDAPSLLAYVRPRTVGDVPTARRNAILAVFDKYGIVRSDFTLTTPLWRVLRRVASSLFERDDNFATNF